MNRVSQVALNSGKPSLYVGDLPAPIMKLAKRVGLVAWDIETSGLDWKKDQIATCQIYIPGHSVHIVRIVGSAHSNLEELLAERKVRKLFHHAMFDLRFMLYQWSANPTNVACTKVASKILHPEEKDHSLQSLLQQRLGTVIDKTERTSDWFSTNLTDEQVQYAARDVLYLPELFSSLRAELIACQRWALAQGSFRYLPIRTRLDVLGSGDVFQY